MDLCTSFICINNGGGAGRGWGAHVDNVHINIIKSLGELSAMAPGRGQQSAHVKIFASCFRSHQALYLSVSIFTVCSWLSEHRDNSDYT